MRIARAVIVGLALPSIVGAFISMIIVTPAIAYLNAVATDGPYFPPPLVALLVVIPLTIMLAPFLLLAVGLYLWSRRAASFNIPIGIAAGVIVGCVFHFVLFASSQSRITNLIAWIALAVIQALASALCLTYTERKNWLSG